MRMRLLERLGRSLRFSPRGRRVRLWVEGWPGEEESRVLEATVIEVAGRSAVLELDSPALIDGREVRFARATPRERGFGLDALWFSFIAVDAAALAGPKATEEEPLGRWAMRLADERRKKLGSRA